MKALALVILALPLIAGAEVYRYVYANVTIHHQPIGAGDAYDVTVSLHNNADKTTNCTVTSGQKQDSVTLGPFGAETVRLTGVYNPEPVRYGCESGH